MNIFKLLGNTQSRQMDLICNNTTYCPPCYESIDNDYDLNKINYTLKWTPKRKIIDTQQINGEKVVTISTRIGTQQKNIAPYLFNSNVMIKNILSSKDRLISADTWTNKPNTYSKHDLDYLNYLIELGVIKEVKIDDRVERIINDNFLDVMLSSADPLEALIKKGFKLSDNDPTIIKIDERFTEQINNGVLRIKFAFPEIKFEYHYPNNNDQNYIFIKPNLLSSTRLSFHPKPPQEKELLSDGIKLYIPKTQSNIIVSSSIIYGKSFDLRKYDLIRDENTTEPKLSYALEEYLGFTMNVNDMNMELSTHNASVMIKTLLKYCNIHNNMYQSPRGSFVNRFFNIDLKFDLPNNRAPEIRLVPKVGINSYGNRSKITSDLWQNIISVLKKMTNEEAKKMAEDFLKICNAGKENSTSETKPEDNLISELDFIRNQIVFCETMQYTDDDQTNLLVRGIFLKALSEAGKTDVALENYDNFYSNFCQIDLSNKRNINLFDKAEIHMPGTNGYFLDQDELAKIYELKADLIQKKLDDCKRNKQPCDEYRKMLYSIIESDTWKEFANIGLVYGPTLVGDKEDPVIYTNPNPFIVTTIPTKEGATYGSNPSSTYFLNISTRLNPSLFSMYTGNMEVSSSKQLMAQKRMLALSTRYFGELVDEVQEAVNNNKTTDISTTLSSEKAVKLKETVMTIAKSGLLKNPDMFVDLVSLDAIKIISYIKFFLDSKIITLTPEELKLIDATFLKSINTTTINERNNLKNFNVNSLDDSFTNYFKDSQKLKSLKAMKFTVDNIDTILKDETTRNEATMYLLRPDILAKYFDSTFTTLLNEKIYTSHFNQNEKLNWPDKWNPAEDEAFFENKIQEQRQKAFKWASKLEGNKPNLSEKEIIYRLKILWNKELSEISDNQTSISTLSSDIEKLEAEIKTKYGQGNQPLFYSNVMLYADNKPVTEGSSRRTVSPGRKLEISTIFNNDVSFLPILFLQNKFPVEDKIEYAKFLWLECALTQIQLKLINPKLSADEKIELLKKQIELSETYSKLAITFSNKEITALEGKKPVVRENVPLGLKMEDPQPAPDDVDIDYKRVTDMNDYVRLKTDSLRASISLAYNYLKAHKLDLFKSEVESLLTPVDTLTKIDSIAKFIPEQFLTSFANLKMNYYTINKNDNSALAIATYIIDNRKSIPPTSEPYLKPLITNQTLVPLDNLTNNLKELYSTLKDTKNGFANEPGIQKLIDSLGPYIESFSQHLQILTFDEVTSKIERLNNFFLAYAKKNNFSEKTKQLIEYTVDNLNKTIDTCSSAMKANSGSAFDTATITGAKLTKAFIYLNNDDTRAIAKKLFDDLNSTKQDIKNQREINKGYAIYFWKEKEFNQALDYLEKAKKCEVNGESDTDINVMNLEIRTAIASTTEENIIKTLSDITAMLSDKTINSDQKLHLQLAKLQLSILTSNKPEAEQILADIKLDGTESQTIKDSYNINNAAYLLLANQYDEAITAAIDVYTTTENEEIKDGANIIVLYAYLRKGLSVDPFDFKEFNAYLEKIRGSMTSIENKVTLYSLDSLVSLLTNRTPQYSIDDLNSFTNEIKGTNLSVEKKSLLTQQINLIKFDRYMDSKNTYTLAESIQSEINKHPIPIHSKEFYELLKAKKLSQNLIPAREQLNKLIKNTRNNEIRTLAKMLLKTTKS